MTDVEVAVEPDTATSWMDRRRAGRMDNDGIDSNCRRMPFDDAQYGPRNATMRVIVRLLLRILLRVRVVGDIGGLAAGRPLVFANCDSALDGVLLGLFLPGAPTVVLPRDAMRNRIVRVLARFIAFATLDPARPLSVKRIVRLVRRGHPVVLFPEGSPTPTGGITKVYDAAGVIAARCDADLVPVRISGTLYTRHAAVGARWPKFRWPRVTVTVLPKEKLPALDGANARDRRRRQSDAVLQLLQRAKAAVRPRQTLYAAFLDAMARFGRRTRIIEDARQQPETYGDLLKATLGLARLTARPTAEGETVGVMMPNLSTTIALILALTATRRRAAMLNFTSGPDALRVACVAANIGTIITSRRFVELARLDAAVRALADRKIIYLEDLRAQLTAADKLWIVGALLRPRAAFAPVAPEETAVVLFTSGSEARAKGVAISHAAILANMAQMGAVIDFGPDDRFLNALPLYHTFGLTACTLMPVMTGTPLFLYTNPLHYRAIPELAYAKACTYIFGTSTFLGHYARAAHPYDFRSVRVVVSGGEKLNAEVAQLWLRKFGLRIMEGYGATECGPAMALNTPLAWRDGAVGRFLPEVEYRLAGVPGVRNGKALHVKSPNLMSGYYFFEQPGVLHPPRSEVGEGWYNTGDVVDIDDDGFVTVVGRVKRFAKIAGEMVSLELVERIANTASPSFKHAATVEQLAGTGESTVLFTTDPALDRLVLLKAARQIGAQDLAVARRIIKVDSLPLLGSGKTDYVTLKVMAVAAA